MVSPGRRTRVLKRNGKKKTQLKKKPEEQSETRQELAENSLEPSEIRTASKPAQVESFVQLLLENLRAFYLHVYAYEINKLSIVVLPFADSNQSSSAGRTSRGYIR